MEVRHVAGMRPFGVLDPVLVLAGIEMGTGRFEVWRLAFADGMEMEGMLARGRRGQIEADQDAARRFRQRGVADLVAARVLEARGRCLHWRSESQRRRKNNRAQDQFLSHRLSPVSS